MLKRSLLGLCISSALLLVSACDGNSSSAMVDEGSGADTPDIGTTTDTGSIDDSNDDDDTGSPDGVDSGDGLVPLTPSDPTEPVASYRLTFEASWSADTHPLNFPAGPHFSGVTGATHNGAVNLWQPGQLATEGFRMLAETGNRNLFMDEVRETITAGRSRQLIEGGGVNPAPGSVSVDFQASQQHPLVTVVSMVAPSPDWIVGIHGVDLRDGFGNFVDSLVVDAIVYDAGTDSGARYSAGNIESIPREPITRLTSNSGDSDFVQGLPIAGRFVFQKQ